MRILVGCLECGQPVSRNAHVCSHCGDPNPIYRKWSTTETVTTDCVWCMGSGKTTRCPWCHGSGRYVQTFQYDGKTYEAEDSPCDMCEETGVVEHTCQNCGGSGRRDETKVVQHEQHAVPVEGTAAKP